MSPSAELSLTVSLVDVGEDVLEHLLAVAIRDADADEVTPPLGSGAGWSSERISWFRGYHHAASGLDGPAQQKSWAIRCDGELAGSIRLRWTGPGTLETGIWMARGWRGRGIGHEALRQVKAHAAASGATGLDADTTAGNGAALALLRGAGAELVFAAASGAAAVPVKARIPLL
ncbi:ribosomal-protein-alanine N-acetyltransferase [Arthrobacter sp. V4I6]|uniref:GNAT family N-acetyltransferase n=1 Tax=unclassified Arthrobacter TaxID=235627 RepID=UPI0027897E1A|nr:MULTISPECIES: GNAT family N-acetyltransferase [unclassified Arthrobacter]MDQ0821154.1 ribosomal-protein-alanine N-acetyltransferase [Arthrobacter sp. V1I7]MDQ0855417.1 ribosomal-protein-alanine N-acetyltransferase [Arthrobacter sp. V4I6]